MGYISYSEFDDLLRNFGSEQTNIFSVPTNTEWIEEDSESEHTREISDIDRVDVMEGYNFDLGMQELKRPLF